MRTSIKWVWFSFILLFLIAIIFLFFGFVVIRTQSTTITKHGLQVSAQPVKLDDKTLKSIYSYNKITPEDLKQNELLLIKVRFTNHSKEVTALSGYDYTVYMHALRSIRRPVTPEDKEILLPPETGFTTIKEFTMLEPRKSYLNYVPFWIPKDSTLSELVITDHFTYTYQFDFD